MNKLRILLSCLAVITMVIFLFGCAQPPKAEETAAKEAIDAARNAEAPAYALSEWSDADRAFTAAEAKMSSKEYNDAKTLFLSTQEKARVAKDAAEKNKADLSAELTQSKEAAENAVSLLKSEFKKLRKRVPKAPSLNIEATIKEAEGSLANANQLILSGKLMEAKAKIADASAKAEVATSALKAATTVKHAKASSAKRTKAVVPKHTSKRKRK